MDLKGIRQGLLGGSFDPVHLTHINLARHARQHLGLNTVTLIPAASPWQRGALGASGEQRLEMLRIAAADEPGIDISPIEIERGGPTYTIDTLKVLPQGPRYFWIIGADQLENFCTWHAWEDIVERVELAVAGRPDSALTPPPGLQARLDQLQRQLHIIPLPLTNLSATKVRQRIADGLSVEGMLHPGVAQYIQQHGLYRHPAA